MAKVSSSARPSSRQSQGAPQQAPPAIAAPAGNTRSTRSQSRDVETPTLRTRGSRQASVESDVSAGGGKGERGGKKGVRKPATTELATVDEDPAIEENSVDDALAAEREAAEDAAEDVRRISHESAGAFSGISGTTAQSSFSQEQIQDMDPELILESLPSLAAAADDMIKFVKKDPAIRRSTIKDITISGTKSNRLFETRAKALKLQLDNFSTMGEGYQRPDVLLRALYGVGSVDEVPASAPRPDVIINKSNLAQMIGSLLAPSVLSDGTRVERFTVLAGLDVAFPKFLLNSVSINDLESLTSVFDVALAIRTQVALSRLHANANDPIYTPDTVIAQTFLAVSHAEVNFENAAAWKKTQARPFNGMDAANWAQIDAEFGISTELKHCARALFEEFRRLDEYTVASINKVRTKYPWESFVEKVCSWAVKYVAIVDTKTADAGGVDALVKAIEDTADEYKIAAERRETLKKAGSASKRIGSGRDLLRRKRLSGGAATEPEVPLPSALKKSPGKERAAESTAEPETEPVEHQDNWVRLEDDGYVPEELLPEVSQVAKRTAAAGTSPPRREPSKQALFIARQPNAQKVSFDESQLSQRLASSAPGRPSRSSGKRPGVDDDEVSGDEGLQTDTRPTDATNERRRLTASGPSKRPRFGSNISPQPGSSRRYVSPASQSPGPRPRQNPGQTFPGPVPLHPEDEGNEPPGIAYQRARYTAKQHIVASQQRTGTQQRVKWSEEEVNALINLIIEHGDGGIKYSYLKKVEQEGDDVLWRRSAEDLRYKARNMKTTMLQSGLTEESITVQWPNWQFVVVDKKAVDRLNKRGISYNRVDYRDV